MQGVKEEIGRLEEIFKFIVHIEADPVKKGLLIKELRDEYGLTFKEISERTGWSIARISELYKAVTKLIPPLLERTLRGEIKASTALELAKLPPKEQERFINVEKIKLKQVKARRRELAIEKSIKEALNRKIEIEIEIPEKKGIKKREIKCPYCGKTFLLEEIDLL